MKDLPAHRIIVASKVQHKLRGVVYRFHKICEGAPLYPVVHGNGQKQCNKQQAPIWILSWMIQYGLPKLLFDSVHI